MSLCMSMCLCRYYISYFMCLLCLLANILSIYLLMGIFYSYAAEPLIRNILQGVSFSSLLFGVGYYTSWYFGLCLASQYFFLLSHILFAVSKYIKASPKSHQKSRFFSCGWYAIDPDDRYTSFILNFILLFFTLKQKPPKEFLPWG